MQDDVQSFALMTKRTEVKQRRAEEPIL